MTSSAGSFFLADREKIQRPPLTGIVVVLALARALSPALPTTRLVPLLISLIRSSIHSGGKIFAKIRFHDQNLQF